MDVIMYSKLMKLENEIKEESVIQTPAGFDWQDHPLVGHLFRTENGIDCDFDVATLKPTGGTTYYVNPSGNDNNSGLTPDQPLQLISTAIAKSDVGTVVLQDGYYNVNRVPKKFSKSVAIVAAEGAHPLVDTSKQFTFTKTDGYTNVYQTESNIIGAYDATLGVYYDRKTSIADVDENANSYYVDSGISYVHTHDGNAPASASRHRYFQNQVNTIAEYSNGETLYLEGIKFMGGTYAAVQVLNPGETVTPHFYAKDCEFSYCTAGNALSLKGTISIVQNCKATHGCDDGFNYHSQGTEPRAIEINCEGCYNGVEGATDNGSTMHDGGDIIRVNGNYHHNGGPNVADVHNGTSSWNLNSVAHDCALTGETSQVSDWVCSDDGPEMWLDTCSAYGSFHSLYGNTTAGIYLRNCAFPNINVSGNTKLIAY